MGIAAKYPNLDWRLKSKMEFSGYHQLLQRCRQHVILGRPVVHVPVEGGERTTYESFEVRNRDDLGQTVEDLMCKMCCPVFEQSMKTTCRRRPSTIMRRRGDGPGHATQLVQDGGGSRTRPASKHSTCLPFSLASSRHTPVSTCSFKKARMCSKSLVALLGCHISPCGRRGSVIGNRRACRRKRGFCAVSRRRRGAPSAGLPDAPERTRTDR